MTVALSGAEADVAVDPSAGREVLAVRGLSKTYTGTLALDDVDLDVRAGEIHCLLGGNGSGKSTLIKILAGVVKADPGSEVLVAGQPESLDSWSTERAKGAGLRFVHQQPAVFLDLSVAENLAMAGGFPTGRGGRIRWRALRRNTTELLQRFQIPATPRTRLGSLRAADRTRVAIVRAVQDREDAESGVLVLDEPTASLPAQEVDALLTALRRYAAAGQTILYVTHRLDEVIAIADRVTVLRDGRKVATVPGRGLTEDALVELIVGRPLENVFLPPVANDEATVVLDVQGLTGGPLRGVDVQLHRGEILGVAGLLGSGRTELLRMLFGAFPRTGGSITFKGRPVELASPAAAMDAGFAYVPEDRQADGIFPTSSVRGNLSAAQVGGYFRGLHMQHRRERADSATSIADFLIRVGSDRDPITTLSGGNQQKVVLARWLRRRPEVLLLDEPTQGVDVGARAEIYGLIRRASEEGTSVLLVASDPEELAHVCDRVVVLRGGRIAASVAAPIEPHRLVELMNVTGAAA